MLFLGINLVHLKQTHPKGRSTRSQRS